MSSYTAVIKCCKCGRELATVNAYHDGAGFYPQDIFSKEYTLPSEFCQECLNGRGDKNE